MTSRQEKVVHQGYLLEEIPNGYWGMLPSTWKSKFYVLRSTTFEVYEGMTCASYGLVYLGHQASFMVSAIVKVALQENACFQINVEVDDHEGEAGNMQATQGNKATRTLSFEAASVGDAHQWVTKLNAAIKKDDVV